MPRATAVPPTLPATIANPSPLPPSPTATIIPTEPAPTATPTPFAWPPAMAKRAYLSRDGVERAEWETAVALEQNLAAVRDDVALALAYRGLAAAPEMARLPVTEPLAEGTRQLIYILNTDVNKIHTVEMVLLAVSDYAYFWFDTTPGLFLPPKELLQQTAVAFDSIYEQSQQYFGSENSPGVDGDARIHIMNASPLTICDTTEERPACGLGGYYASNNTLPASVDPYSNEREMFVMNGALFGSGRYLAILGHEFRHMIEDNYDANEWDWAVEGSAMLAEDLLGFPSDGLARANQFLRNPDQQLNRWTDGNPTPYYGQGYLLNRYLYTQLGQKLYQQFATHPEPAFHALDLIAAENGLLFSGQSLWLDWLTALAIHNEPDAPTAYRLGAEVDSVTMASLAAAPALLDLTVNQYAADYYLLRSEVEATLFFTGSNHVPLLPLLPLAGERMWVANRANYSWASLIRPFDLTTVPTATLNYAVYHEIEVGYDFAYVAISVDGGQTWQGLETAAMQGLSPEDDPADSALTPRFYTGDSHGWLLETADLTPYTGQIVHIRFDYITDPILTFGGLALDNIHIPEIGFYDDDLLAEGWQAIGFVRATGYLPQQWHLQLISFASGQPTVQHLAPAADHTLSIPITTSSADGRWPILIIAATAPMTLQPAHYQLEIRAK